MPATGWQACRAQACGRGGLGMLPLQLDGLASLCVCLTGAQSSTLHTAAAFFCGLGSYGDSALQRPQLTWERLAWSLHMLPAETKEPRCRTHSIGIDAVGSRKS